MRCICTILAIAAAAGLSLLHVDTHADVIFFKNDAAGFVDGTVDFSNAKTGGVRRFTDVKTPDASGAMQVSAGGSFGGAGGQGTHTSTTTFSGGVFNASGSGSASADANNPPAGGDEDDSRRNLSLFASGYQLDFQVIETPAPYSLNAMFSKSATIFIDREGGFASTYGTLQAILEGENHGRIHRLDHGLDGPGAGSLTGNGMLLPDSYRLSVQVHASSGSTFTDSLAFEGGLATAGYNFSFSVGAPTPNVRWINEGSGAFLTAENWQPEEVPDAENTAIFDLNQVYTVGLGGVETVVDRARVHQGLVALDDGTLRLGNANVQTPSLVVGVSPGETAILQFLSGSALRSVNAVVGASAGSRGTVSFDEVGAWINSGQMVIGRGGRGELLLDRTSGHVVTGELVVGKDITGNGRVDITTGSAADGPGVFTGKTVIGAEGFGEMLVRTGGLVRTTAAAELGSLGPNSHGFVSVSGRSLAGNRRSTWEVADTLVVGGAGEGDLDITAGGLVTGSTAVIGSNPGSQGSVLVEGKPAGGEPSVWFNSEDVLVGVDGRGEVRVLDGGFVVSQNATVGGEASGTGTVTISGVNTNASPAAPSQWSANGEFVIGRGGSGDLLIEDGGKLQSVSGKIGQLAMPSAIGIATVRGMHAQTRTRSTWEFTELLEVGVGGRGLLQVVDGGVVTGEGAIVGAQSAFPGATGTITVRGAAPGGAGDVSAFSVDHLAVGLTGTGFVNVEAGGAMLTQSASIGGLTTSTGTVEVRGSDIATGIGSQWVNAGDLNVGIVGPGTLIIANGGRVGSGSVRVGPAGAIRGDGTLLVSQGNRVVENGGVIEPGLSPGTLTIEGNYQQTATGRLDIEVTGKGAGQFDVLNVTGNATLGGRLRLEFIDGFAPRQGEMIEFLDVTGTLSNTFANVELRNLAPEFQFEVRSAGGAMTMVALNDGVFVPPPPSNWNVDANGNWSSAANWTGEVPDAAGAVAIFGSKITAPRTVTVDVPVTLGRVEFASTHSYTIAGSRTITLHANSIAEEIIVTSGSHTIGAPVLLADDMLVTVTPAASNLSITGTLSASGIDLTKAGPGTLTLNNLRAAGLSINAGTVAIAPNGTDAGTSVLGAISIAGGATPTAKLDINNNAAIINYTGISPAATIRQQILAGRGGPGFGATWTGQGITSSEAAAAANAVDAESRSLGYADNSTLPLGTYTSFRGQPVDDTSVLIAFTRTGDANLDGLVNDDDVTIVGATYAPGVPQPSWALGDFDYNGFVDDDDVTLLGVFYDPSAAPLAVSRTGSTEAVATIPEPGTLALAALAALLLAAVALLRLCRCTSARYRYGPIACS